MNFKPQDVVAVLLAMIIIIVVCGAIFMPRETQNIEIASMWSDIIKVILGGLIGYIMIKDKK